MRLAMEINIPMDIRSSNVLWRKISKIQRLGWSVVHVLYVIYSST